MASFPTILLFEIKLTAFKTSGVAVNARFPCRRSKISDRAWGGVIEDVFDFFERLLRSLGEQEEDVDEHGGTKHPKHNVDLPACCLVSLVQRMVLRGGSYGYLRKREARNTLKQS